ncbi:MAG TPA: alcohol dehydrogenase catalytic domain-containing protein [Anaerolineaceae bacterium]|nr:alcohol dehydrogenase catalytic domain-containing protein [Anaerolineaceae bacterium]
MNENIPKTMQALVLPSPGKLEISTIPVPVAGPQEVLCRVRAVAICGSDPEIFRGDLAGTWPPYYPFIPGHEWAGEVVAVGEGVSNFQPGDRVAGEPHKGCGYCRNCLEGRYNLCENYGRPETGHRHYGFISPGAYAQYIATSIKSITKMPLSVSFREGAMVDTAAVALHGLELTGITPGGTVAIIGPGPIGLIAMRLARILGASKVIMVGRRSRLEAAGKLGADVLVDIEKEEPVAAVRSISNGLGIHEAFECSGAKGTFDQAVRMVKKGGRVALIGVPPDSVVEELHFKYIVHNELAIFGSRADPNATWKIVEMVASGQLILDDLITHTFPLENFEVALDTFVNRREGAIKVVVEPNGIEKR